MRATGDPRGMQRARVAKHDYVFSRPSRDVSLTADCRNLNRHSPRTGKRHIQRETASFIRKARGSQNVSKCHTSCEKMRYICSTPLCGKQSEYILVKLNLKSNMCLQLSSKSLQIRNRENDLSSYFPLLPLYNFKISPR